MTIIGTSDAQDKVLLKNDIQDKVLQDKVLLTDATMLDEQPELGDCLLEYPTFDPDGQSPIEIEHAQG